MEKTYVNANQISYEIQIGIKKSYICLNEISLLVTSLRKKSLLCSQVSEWVNF